MYCYRVFINLLASTMFLTSCKGIYSQYGSDIIDNKKICILSKIDSEHSRLFIRRINEFPYIGRYPDCDYLVILGLFQKNLSIRTSVGIKLHNEPHVEAKYSLFKINNEKYKQVEDIFYNTATKISKNLTGSKNNSTLKNMIVNEEKEERERYEDALSSYNENLAAIDGILEKINDGGGEEFISYATNPILITSEVQSYTDIKNMLAEKLAERMMNNIVIDIVNWNKQKHFELCKSYYNEYYLRSDNKEKLDCNNKITKHEDVKKTKGTNERMNSYNKVGKKEDSKGKATNDNNDTPAIKAVDKDAIAKQCKAVWEEIANDNGIIFPKKRRNNMTRK